MKVYLVGGAIRDDLLGLPVSENDWVVVGSTPDDMLAQGFKQVGKSFPVFLHPQSKEEYALARTEKKSGHGYYGFDLTFSPTVTLEQDLLRRDLTINAIAKDESGKFIDPYHGIDDLNNKIIRHVSEAFVEDPVRVLRVARFMCKFAPLGFKLHESTEALMREMVRQGECQHLVPERVWQEWCKSLEYQDPTQFIIVLRRIGLLASLMPELDRCFGVPALDDDNGYHDVGLQSLATLRLGKSFNCGTQALFTLLLSDCGKALSPLWLWPYHENIGLQSVKAIKSLCQRLKVPNEYKTQALLFAEFKSQLLDLDTCESHDIIETLLRLDALRRPENLDNLLFLCKILDHNKDDALSHRWKQVRDIVANIDVLKTFPDLTGAAIKTALYDRRVHLVETWKKHDKKQ